MSKLKIELFPLADLAPWTNNARTHSKKQITQIAQSITAFGFTNPVLIDDNDTILAGHGRVAAAGTLGMTEVPCVRLSHMSPAQKRAYVLADNKLALNAGWDEDLLAGELEALLDIDLDFSIEATGFSISEVDLLIEGKANEEDGDPADDALPDVKAPARCALGDVWQLGPHRLVCDDALKPENAALLMDGELASMDGSIHFICMDWRHIREITQAGDAVFSELKNMITWVKDNGGMGTFYRSRHELIFAFKHGDAPHINSFELGQHGRYRTNVWEYKGVNSRGAGRMEELKLHPTVKPVQMIADAIKDVSGRGEIVLDLFGGSGSTLIAAHKTGRRAYLMELDPLYCDVILQRWELYANDDAVQLVCGLNTEPAKSTDIAALPQGAAA